MKKTAILGSLLGLGLILSDSSFGMKEEQGEKYTNSKNMTPPEAVEDKNDGDKVVEAAPLGDEEVLFEAIEKNDINTISLILSSLEEDDELTPELKRKLTEKAVQNKNLDTFKTVFRYTNDPLGALYEAARIENTDVLEFLQEQKGFDPIRALYEAARMENTDVLRFLQEQKGFDPNAKLPDENDPVICIAAANRHCIFMDFLIGEPGIDVNARDNDGNTALHIAIKKEGREGSTSVASALLNRSLGEITNIRVLKRKNAKIKEQNEDNDGKKKQKLNPINDDSRILEVNAKDNEGQTPLHVAAEYGNTEAVRLLLEHEGVIVKNKKGKVKFSHEDTDINATDNQGRTPLHIAAENNDEYIAQLLLKKGGVRAYA